MRSRSGPGMRPLPGRTQRILLPEQDNPMIPIVSPDCRDKNHQKCPGDAWDEAHDHGTECECGCHAAEAAISSVVTEDATAPNHSEVPDSSTCNDSLHVGQLAAVVPAALPVEALKAAYAAYQGHLNNGELTTLEDALAAALIAAAPIIQAQVLREAADEIRLNPYGDLDPFYADYHVSRANRIEGKVS